MKTLHAALAGLILSLALAGCAQSPKPAVVESPPTAAALSDLQKVRDSYAAGNYGDVIRTVSRSGDLAQSPRDMRIEAMKLQAFSYCLTKHRTLCEEQFERIFALDPNFELSAAERGHPQWGPVYEATRPAAAAPTR